MHPYQNPECSIESRIDDLMERMDFDEKLAELSCLWMGKTLCIFDDDFNVDHEECAQYMNRLGHVAKPSDRYDSTKYSGEPYRTTKQTAEFVKDLQSFAIEKGRLGIPLLFHDECLHGFMASEATCMPQSIALASTWDLDLVERVYAVSAREARSTGVVLGLSPVLDVVRDIRWGRVEETFGEDPYLVGEMGRAAVLGLQGKSLPLAEHKVFAGLKHFIAHSAPEGGRNLGPINYSDYVLRETFVEPFEKVLQQTLVNVVMPSFNEINGKPVHANREILTDLLRGDLKFDGLVVSDYMAINNIHDDHFFSASQKESAKLALDAGVDVEFADFITFQHIPELVEEGEISIERIDQAVRRVLRLKFMAGLFENPLPDPELAESITNNASARSTALEAAQKSCVLLKNKDNLLPLSESAYSKIAVIGPNANQVIKGGYSTDKLKHESTIYEGVKSRVNGVASVSYAVGVELTTSRSFWDDKVELVDESQNQKHIAEAVELANDSDLIILVLGENENTSREAWAIGHPGDRDSIDLVGQQEDLLKAMVATGKDVVLCLNHGRPIAVNYAEENVPAILDCWYLGQATGEAVASILFGDVNPSGRLPVTVPRSVGQIPMFYNRRKSSTMPYLLTKNTPLYPFGFGLSYTSFEYSELLLESESIDLNQVVKAKLNIKNVGSREGAEVVQLYINDKVSSKTRPIIELKGFRRIALLPGESKEVVFDIGFEQLSFHDGVKRIVEPGEFEIMVGPNSTETQLKILTVNAFGSVEVCNEASAECV